MPIFRKVKTDAVEAANKAKEVANAKTVSEAAQKEDDGPSEEAVAAQKDSAGKGFVLRCSILAAPFTLHTKTTNIDEKSSKKKKKKRKLNDTDAVELEGGAVVPVKTEKKKKKKKKTTKKQLGLPETESAAVGNAADINAPKKKKKKKKILGGAVA